MKIIRRIPKEQYAYYELVFDTLDEYKQNYKAIKNEIDEQEKTTPEPPEFKREGNFILNNKK